MRRGGQDEEQAFVGFWFLVWVRLMSPKITQVPDYLPAWRCLLPLDGAWRAESKAGCSMANPGHPS